MRNLQRVPSGTRFTIKLVYLWSDMKSLFNGQRKKWREALLSSQTVSVYLTTVILQRLDYFISFTEDVCMWKCNNFVINRQDVVQIHYFRLRSLKPSLTVNPGNLRMCDILLKVMLCHP